MVGVLVFVHQDVLEILLEISAYLVVLFEKFHHLDYQVPEVQRAGLGELFLVAVIDLRGFQAGRVVDGLGVDQVGLGVEQVVLGAGDEA